jgi:hypothetical protein
MYSFNPLQNKFDFQGSQLLAGFKVRFTDSVYYKLNLFDDKSLICFDNVSQAVIEIPNDSQVNFPINSEIACARLTDHLVYFQASTGVNIRAADSPNGNNIRSKHSVASVIKLSANEWLLSGDLKPQSVVIIDIPWSPSNTITSLWLDSSNASTITLSSGTDSVIEWKDGSGNNYNVYQDDLMSCPSWSTVSINGLSAIEFKRGISNSTVLSSNLPLIGSQPFTIICIVQLTTNSTTNTILDGGSGSNLKIVRNSANNFQMSAPSLLIDTIPVLTGPAIISCVFNSTTSSIRINGNSSTTGSVGSNSIGAGLFIGGDSTASSSVGLEGAIGEIIMFDHILPLSAIQMNEGYLAWKWKTRSSLPSIHPYKTSIPTIEQVI